MFYLNHPFCLVVLVFSSYALWFRKNSEMSQAGKTGVGKEWETREESSSSPEKHFNHTPIRFLQKILTNYNIDAFQMEKSNVFRSTWFLFKIIISIM